jgi:dihydrofolate reductase
MKSFSLVVAMDANNGIGKNGDLAWRLPPDLKHFKEVTMNAAAGKRNAVIMGRKTWDSLPEKFKPLPGRLNVVLSQNTEVLLPLDVLLFSSLEQALSDLDLKGDIDQIFVIGGGQIFTLGLLHPACKDLYVTHLKGDFNCDAFFPEVPASFKKINESPWFNEGPITYSFCQYRKEFGIR